MDYPSESFNSPVEASIRSKLTSALAPTHLQVINESSMHNVPKNSETHFKVIIVSPEFNDVTALIKRHRMVNDILAGELATDGAVHALSIVAKSPNQWVKMLEKAAKNSNNSGNLNRGMIPPSPPCQGGDGSLPSRKRD